MALFRHHDQSGPDQSGQNLYDYDPTRYRAPDVVPGLADIAARQGRQPAPHQHPFDGHLETGVHEVSRAMYRNHRGMSAVAAAGIRVGGTVYSDCFRGTVNGRDVIVTPDVQQRIMAHDDWVFWSERYLFGCISKGRFKSVDGVTLRISEVLDIVGAIPVSVMPQEVNHSEDALAARITQINSVEDGIAFLTSLTPAEREQVAHSGTPLAPLAYVQTPQEAMASFQGLPQGQKTALLAMLMRVQDQHGGR